MRKVVAAVLALAPAPVIGASLCSCADPVVDAPADSVVPGHSTPWSRAGARNPGLEETVVATPPPAAAEPIEMTGRWGPGGGSADEAPGEDSPSPSPQPAAGSDGEVQ